MSREYRQNQPEATPVAVRLRIYRQPAAFVDFSAIFQEKREKIPIMGLIAVCRVKNRLKAIFGDYNTRRQQTAGKK
ncbi:MAG: hypothetical protein LBS37_04480 [Treponema sp.]|nr:hypothetical protein [Treponema sp.]